MLKERGSFSGRLIDRYIGIPIVFLLGIFIKRRPLTSKVKRIAIIRTAAIGDTVLLSAIINDIKRAHSEAEIILFAGPSNIGITSLLPLVSKVYYIPVSNLWRSAKTIRKAGYFDVVIDTGQWPRLDALFAFLCKSNYRIGFQTPKQFKHFTFHYVAAHSNKIHELDNFRQLIKPLIDKPKANPSLLIPNEEIPFQDKPYIIFHPWPGGINAHLKEWPFDYWSMLANYIALHDLRIIITGAKTDIQPTQLLVSKISSGIDVISVAGQLNLKQTTALIHKAKALISVNTGIMHIGAAIGTPVIGLHGPTNSLRWGPTGEKAVAVSPVGEGCGYLNLGFEYAGNPTDCMQRIDSQNVYRVFCELLKLPLLSPA